MGRLVQPARVCASCHDESLCKRVGCVRELGNRTGKQIEQLAAARSSSLRVCAAVWFSLGFAVALVWCSLPWW